MTEVAGSGPPAGEGEGGGAAGRGDAGPVRVLVLTGPTAAGKSALALAVARALGGEVVSADSAMVYRGLDVGTAKPTPAERRAVPHHLLDVRAPHEPFSVAEYRRLADAALRAVAARGRVPLLVGGTGLYIRHVLREEGLPPVPPDPALRARLEARARAEGPAALHRELLAVDPRAAAAIPPGNVRRVVRALEVWHLSGRPISSYWGPARERYPALILVCDRPAGVLRARIAARVHAMLAGGLVEEVRALLRRGVPASAQALQALGYKETVAWLQAGAPPGALEPLLVRATQRYAKRQRTWWRAEARARWLDLGQEPAEAALPRVLAAWREAGGEGAADGRR